MMTAKGIVIRIRVADIRRCGRSTQGVRLINVEAGDEVVSVERVVRRQQEEKEEPSSNGKSKAERALGNGQKKDGADEE